MSGFGRIFGRGRRDQAEHEAPAAKQRQSEEHRPRDDHAELSTAERIDRLAALPLWTDSHCHLQTAKDLHAVLDRAQEQGTRRLVVVGTDEESSRHAVAIAGETSGYGSPPVELWATVGLHPHDASTGLGGVRSYLDELSVFGLSRAKVTAVGECGLDYHYDHSPRAVQRKVFAEQVGFAHRHGLALVIHTREAWEDTFAVLDAEGAPSRMVFHCFTGGPDEARACLDRGAYLSFSGIVTFTSANDLREAATICPMDRMLVETDSPFLTPVPHRGKANEPAYVPLVGAAIASLKGLDDASVAQATTANANVVFNLHG
ncbi:MAG: TatD family hydrolase [Acidimicrobiales bacterium]|jgi:TatD DNase family protein